ncbi:hypothetical protein JR316_0011087 [Psilocybe cubensis]|uniref:F-box domain-containing protein n=2 Tax=Psilocybe cubensis TaxID=181762 RepID=A0A8H7XKP8_PSICU|nr:hypothetical protein JR316_0011087 [Psilocybe cubensis]KAH9477170.1 hypothetical protein JR316_0011087 [Psilocybe cubensis]
MNLVSLDEDVLVHIASFLNPVDILRLSETCRAMNKLIHLRIVWTNACSYHIIAHGYPFPTIPLDEIPTMELMLHTIHSHQLARRWHDGISKPRRIKYISGRLGTTPEVRFLPGKLLLIISKTVWSTLSVWDYGSAVSKRVCEWSPRGAILSGVAVNGDPRSEATVAVAMHLNEKRTVVVLSLKHDGSLYELLVLQEIQAEMKPITLEGDILALSDEVSQTVIWNLKTKTYGLLQHLALLPLQVNECIQVVFAYQSVLVVRAQTVHLFPFPELGSHVEISCEPLAEHSFGWVDGQSVNICPFLSSSRSTTSKMHTPLTIFVRGESDDPWASDIYNLELYTLEPNPDYTASNGSPYLFPPRLRDKVACLRGSLTCRRIVLGRLGTAAWIQPRDRFASGLLADIPTHLVPSTVAHESLIITAFPGSLSIKDDYGGTVIGKKIFENEVNAGWTSFDYDEVGGRVAVASSFGRVTVLEL